MSRGAELRLRIGAGLLGALACACGSEGPAWIALENGTRSATGSATKGLRIEPDGGAAWVDHPLAPSVWSAGERAGVWSALRPDGVGFMKSGEELNKLAGELCIMHGRAPKAEAAAA